MPHRSHAVKITDIEVIPLRIPYEDRIRKAFYHFGMNEEVTVYKFHTDTGLIGLGENPGPPFEQDLLDAYLGTNPFDHVMGTGRFNLDMACYDLMGKHLGLPTWKLMGQQVREWVSMGWWMPCMSPEDSAAEVEEAAARGYRGLKCKARAFYDIVEQAQAMQEAAPPDFRIEFDFNGALVNVERALPILRQLEQIPIVKGIEEPIFAYDIEGWRRLHQEIRIPFYLHGVSTIFDGPSRQPSGPWLGLRAGDFDGALCSHETIRNALAASWAFAAANTPILLQYGRHRHHCGLCLPPRRSHAHGHPAGRNRPSHVRRRPNRRAASNPARLYAGAHRPRFRSRTRRGRNRALPRCARAAMAAPFLRRNPARRPRTLLPRPAPSRAPDETRR